MAVSVSFLGQDTTDDILNDDSSSCTSTTETEQIEQPDNSHDVLESSEPNDDVIVGKNTLKQWMYSILEHKLFSYGVVVFIILNTVFIIVQLSIMEDSKSRWYLTALNAVFLLLYVVELSMRLYVWQCKYWCNGWNILDIILISSYVLDFCVLLIVHSFSEDTHQMLQSLSNIVTSFQGLRLLRIIRFIKKLRMFVLTVFQSIPNMSPILVLIFLVLYIFAIIGRALYCEVLPDRFGNLAMSSLTLFQLLTLDDWFAIYSNVRDNHPDHQHIIVYLVLFIIMEAFIFINLFVGVIVETLAHTTANSKRKSFTMHHHQMHKVQHDASEADLTRGNHHDNNISDCHELQRLKIEDMYRHSNIALSDSDIQLLTRYWHVMGLLEQQLETNNKRQCTVNQLVDLVEI